MSAPRKRWIVIPDWERFQHYKDRDPLWIKNYTRLMADWNYLGLTFRQRGILHGIWILYAASGCELGANPAQLGRMLGSAVADSGLGGGSDAVRMRDLESLSRAGFIQLSASKPLAPRYPSRASREPDTEPEKKEHLPDQKRTEIRTPAGLENGHHRETLEELGARLAARAAPVGSEARLFEVLPDMDDGSPAVIRSLLDTLPAHTIELVREEIITAKPRRPTAYAVDLLKKAQARRKVAT